MVSNKIPWNKGKKNIYSIETRNKISSTLKKKYSTGEIIHPRIGKKLSLESKMKMSLAHKGKISGNFGHKGKKPWSYIDGRSKSPISRGNNNGKIKSHLVYCSQENNFNRVPKGMIIHHLDLDPKNNTPNNLIMIPDNLHRKFHNELIKRYKKLGGKSFAI